MSAKSTWLIGRVSSMASSSSSTANPTANSQDDVQAIVSPLGYKSAVWKYFGFLKKDGSTDKTHAICKKCRSAIKYSGNTTNLSGHLIKKHGIDPHEACGNVVDVSGGSSALSTPALSSFFPAKTEPQLQKSDEYHSCHFKFILQRHEAVLCCRERRLS